MSSNFNAINLHSNLQTTISLTDTYLDDITVLGNYAYIADHNTSRLEIVDISNLSNFTIKGTYEYKSEDFCGLKVVGSYAYIAGGEDGIEIFNISDISNPTFVKQVKIPAFSLDTNKDYLYAKSSMRSYPPVYISVLKIEEDSLSLIHKVSIPESSSTKIKDGILFYVTEED